MAPAMSNETGSPAVGWCGWRRLAKRALDIGGAAIGLAVLSPLLGLVAATNWLFMGRPILFRQVRPGFKGLPFEVVKFRTMRVPERDEVWFRTDEERLTSWGRWIRRTSIDELPELWNVLKGEMSLVGPRPLLMEYLAKYSPEQMRRHEMPPGITGWAQINGRQSIPFSERLKLDVWYVDNWSLRLDGSILVRTVRRLAGARDVIPGQDVDEVDDLGLSPDTERDRSARGEE
jgi:sugar transferase EpsL